MDNNRKDEFLDGGEADAIVQDRKLFSKTTGRIGVKGQKARLKIDRVMEKGQNDMDSGRRNLKNRHMEKNELLIDRYDTGQLNNIPDGDYSQYQTNPYNTFTSRTHDEFINH